MQDQMTVNVQELTKIFGAQRAVDRLSFSLNRGEIVGFLGPNGAGKSTTMKMITGLLTPDEGHVEVCGHALKDDSLAARRLIGYLPEHNPLYKDMYIREYLELVAGVHHLPDVKGRIDEMIELTGLQREAHKQIGTLSKGYRQRVGLAQALIHDPEVLVLDEPTSGLDPNQLADIRKLIKRIGQQKTVLFSTHIMQEVQAVCDRVIIINLGKMVADAPIHKLDQMLQGQGQLDVVFREKADVKLLRAIPGVTSIESGDAAEYRIIFERDRDIREHVFMLAVEQGWVILEMNSERRSMEDIFHRLTQTN